MTVPARHFSHALTAILLTAVTAACTSEAYDSGDGRYSRLRADFAMAHTSATGLIDRAVTDDGSHLTFAPAFSASWATKADTTYRALLYYNDADGGSDRQVEGVTSAAVAVCRIMAAPEVMRTDPVTPQSFWRSADGHYLNLALDLKRGNTDDSAAHHTLGIVAADTLSLADGTRLLRLRLYHDQGGVPEYYTSRTYLSIPADDLSADSVTVDIVTYKGTRTLGVRR